MSGVKYIGDIVWSQQWCPSVSIYIYCTIIPSWNCLHWQEIYIICHSLNSYHIWYTSLWINNEVLQQVHSSLITFWKSLTRIPRKKGTWLWTDAVTLIWSGSVWGITMEDRGWPGLIPKDYHVTNCNILSI